MTTSVWRILSALVGCFCIAAASATDPVTPSRPAGNRLPNVDTNPARSSGSLSVDSIAQLALSDRLAAWGMSQSDPVALVVAAKIRKTLPRALQNGGAFPTESLLARAESLAPGNAVVASLIRDTRSIRTRDIPKLATGLGLLERKVRRRAADRAEVIFKANEPASVYVRALVDVDIDLRVYDELNNLICSDQSTGPETRCHWRPRWDGSYLIDIQNNNDAEIGYVIALNAKLAESNKAQSAAP